MKAKFLKTVSLSIALLIAMISCNKDDDNATDSPAGGDFYLTAKIDGTDFTADLGDPATWGAFKYHAGTLTISVADDVANVGQGTIMINLLSSYKGAGTYTVGVGSTGNNYARYTQGSMATGNLNSWNAETSHNASGTGTVTVTSDANNIVEGTFGYTGYSTNGSSKKISEGKFRLKIK